MMDGTRPSVHSLKEAAPRTHEHLSTSSLTGDNLKDLASSLRQMNTPADVVHNATAAGIALRASLAGDLRLMGGVDEMVKQLRYRVVASKPRMKTPTRWI